MFYDDTDYDDNVAYFEEYGDEDEVYSWDRDSDNSRESEDSYNECPKCSAENAYEYVATLKPTISSGVPKLTEMAFICIASTLWNHENISLALSNVTKKCTKESREWMRLRNRIFLSTGELPVPKSMAEEVNKYVRKMETEINNWVSYHYRTVFLKKGLDNELYNVIHLIVWHHDGTINCKLTAKNMLTFVRFSDIVKFRFLCTYCLKDEMEQLSPMIFTSNAMDYLDFSQYPLICYWNSYFRNELHKIATGNASIDSFMLRQDNVDNWSAKEYFFDRLSPDEQVQQTIWLIDTYGVTYQNLVLMKLNDSQRLLVYMDRAVKIITNYAKTEVNYEKFLSTWHEIRNMITQDQFVSLFHELLRSENNDVVLEDIWTSVSDDFKHHILNHNNHEIFEKVLCSWKWSDKSSLLFKMLSDASPYTKKYIIREEFFSKYCDGLLAYDKLPELDRLLNFCLPEIEDLEQFKRDLVINSKSTKTRCLKYYATGNIKELNDFLGQFFTPYLALQYKKELATSSDGILNGIIKNRSVLPRYIISTLADVRNLITLDQFVLLFSEIAKARPFDTTLTLIWNSEPYDFKCKLLNYNNHEFIGKVFKLLEGTSSTEFLFTMLRNVTSNDRKEITKKTFFIDYCETLLSSDKFSLANRLVNFCLPEHRESLEFKRILANNSKSLELQCLKYFATGNSEGLHGFQRMFSTPDSDIFFEYRKNLLMSSAGMEMCVKLLNSKTDMLVLNTIIEHTLHSTDLATTFKKEILFLPSAIHTLQNLIEKGRFNDVRSCMDRYLISVEDRKALKTRLVGDPVKEMRKVLVRSDECHWKSFLLWYFEDEELINKFRRGLAIDKIFIDMLKSCIFIRYDSLLPNCKFRSATEIKFHCLDRFLIWYFRSSEKVKKYKLRKIDSFKDIELINILLKKADDRYLKAVMEWFFQNDSEEIAKFKTKYHLRNNKICKMI